MLLSHNTSLYLIRQISAPAAKSDSFKKNQNTICADIISELPYIFYKTDKLCYNISMQGRISSHVLAGNKCSIYLPQAYLQQDILVQKHPSDIDKLTAFPVVYLLGEANIEPIISIVEEKMPDAKGKHRGCKPFILVGIESTNWERDFSPWRAEDSLKQTPFTGNADKYLAMVTDKLMPLITSTYRASSDPKDTAFAGYSLAGLTSVYAMYSTKKAHKIASISGSLWYNDWLSWCENQSIPEITSTDDAYRIYLSLGKAESQTSNEQMATVDTCTQKTYRILQNQLSSAQGARITDSNLFFEYTEGGHFSDVQQRIAKALEYLEAE